MFIRSKLVFIKIAKSDKIFVFKMVKIDIKIENKRSHREVNYTIKRQICQTYIQKKKENSNYTQEMLIEHFNTIIGFNIPKTTISGILKKSTTL